jgi:hypothetical protein
MQIKNEIIGNFRNFIQQNGTIEDAQKNLKEMRNITIGDFNLKDSRCIWMSLMLYKFKREMDVSEELWKESRQLIISLLKSDPDLKSVMIKYLNTFVIWQSEDLQDTMKEIGGNYYNLIQIKKSIENTNNAETIEHWLPHYEQLIEKIRVYCKSMGSLDKLDEFVINIEQEKYNIVKEMMDTVYWEKMQEDIEANKLDIVYSNLSELKTTLLDIIPKSVNIALLNEHFDIEYIKHIVANGAFDEEYLLNLFFFVIKILKEWDSEAFGEKYDEEIRLIEKITGSESYKIRSILQKLMCLAMDLKNRKALWNIILKK